MKMSSFLFLSVALHAAVLAYPALRLESRNLSPVVVTVLDADGGSAGGSKGDGAAPEKKAAPTDRKASLEKRRAQSIPEPEQVVELPKTISTSMISSDVSGAVAVATGESVASGALENSSAPNGGDAAAGGSGNEGGRGGAGLGDAHGNGNGGSPYVQVSYAYCPKPAYPERARRGGWEGTVTLRVLVDEEGKSKSLEVNRSSGFAVLDEAALETIKTRCRFKPARYGEKPVERWVEFPVVFKLADLKH
jgi:TonB family protein